jgi:hypothetical protein
MVFLVDLRHRGTVVGVVTKARAGRQRNSLIPGRARGFYLIYCVKTGSGTFPAACKMGVGTVISPGLKRPVPDLRPVRRLV